MFALHNGYRFSFTVMARILLLLAGALAIGACNDDGKNGKDGENGLETLTAVTDEPPGVHCPNGGLKIQTGLDTNNNGQLDPNEVMYTHYVCNGLDGADGEDGQDGEDGYNTLVVISTVPAGPVCPTGGKRISAGLDLNRDGILEPREVQETFMHCNPDAPAAPALSLDYVSVKTFLFHWSLDPEATYYRLFEDPDGVSGFSLIAVLEGGDGSYAHIVPLYARANAQYLLQSCNAWGCSQSSPAAMVTVDIPSLVESIGYFKASNTEASDVFGVSVSLSADGNTLAVGARFEDSVAANSGAVYVFVRTYGSTWEQQAFLKADVPEAAASFGFSVSLNADGSTLAVGAPLEDSIASESGGVYIFTRTGSAWSQQALIKASDAALFDSFGSVISLSAAGNTLAVGASGRDNSTGAAYVFTRSGSVWTEQQILTASNAEPDDIFGFSVSLSGDGTTLVAGALLEDGAGNALSASGAVYVFVLNGSWTEQALLRPSNAVAGDRFGSAVSLNTEGNILAAGADQGLTASDLPGKAAVFIRSASVWTEQQLLTASNADNEDRFVGALSLSADGTIVVVGAKGEASDATGIDGDSFDNSEFDAGAAYVFIYDGSLWVQQAYVKASNTGADDAFGTAVGLSADGQTLAVGAIGESSSATGINGDQSDNTAVNSGAVYVY